MAKSSGPVTPRDFQRAAHQRLTTAEFLHDNRYNLDATYLAGYAIECALKALILQLTAAAKQPDTLKKISAGRKMHDFEVLAGLLKDLGQDFPIGLAKKFRRYEWSTALRYETGRTATAETRGFLKVAKETCDWVKGKMP